MAYKKLDICEINLSEGEGRQTIYWDSIDQKLHSTEGETLEYICETYEEAVDVAYSLWAQDRVWGLEWMDYWEE